MMYEGEDEESFYEAFSFTTDRPDLVWFDTESGDGELNNVLHFNATAIQAAADRNEKLSVTVTVSAKYPKYANLPEYTTFSFTLTVVSGVAVTTDAELRSAQAEGYATGAGKRYNHGEQHHCRGRCSHSDQEHSDIQQRVRQRTYDLRRKGQARRQDGTRIPV